VYTVIDEKHREKQVFRHVMRTQQLHDTLIYEEQDDGFFLGVSKTPSERFIVLSSNDHSTSEVWCLFSRPLSLSQRAFSPPLSLFTDSWSLSSNDDESCEVREA